MSNKENPATFNGGREFIIKAVGAAIDAEHPTELSSGLQSESYAVSVLQKRFRLSYWRARLACQHSGLGGAE